MEKRFLLEGTIEEKTAKDFKAFLKTILTGETVYIRIRSLGGNVEFGTRIGNFIYYMKKYRKCTFVTEGEVFQSAAFKIFIRGDRRVVQENPPPDASIHLPVPHKNKEIKPGNREEAEQITVDFIKGLTKLSEKEIRDLNNIPLSIAFMLEKGIATESVKQFPVIS